VPTSQYIHPEFGFFCPAPRIRRSLRVALACLAIAGLGAVVLAASYGPEFDAAATRFDDPTIAETVPATSLLPFAVVGAGLTAVIEGAHTSDQPSCVDGSPSGLEGNCVGIKLRKPRKVRVATDRPAIAAVPIGRSAIPTTSAIDAAPPAAANARHQGDSAKSDQAATAIVTSVESTEPSQKSVAKPKKVQRSAHRQNQRRDQYWFGAPSWREVRVDDWGARSYAPRESDYQRGGYGRQGFGRNFW
jgi:hypothetical protein